MDSFLIFNSNWYCQVVTGCAYFPHCHKVACISLSLSLSLYIYTLVGSSIGLKLLKWLFQGVLSRGNLFKTRGVPLGHQLLLQLLVNLSVIWKFGWMGSTPVRTSLLPSRLLIAFWTCQNTFLFEMKTKYNLQVLSHCSIRPYTVSLIILQI